MTKNILMADKHLAKHLKTALPVAREAALQAGALIKRKFGKFGRLEHKKDSSLVTEVDKGSEKLILRALKKKFPNDHFEAEETGSTASKNQSPFRWHIDPLDGTSNFVHGFPFFCVSIGLEYVGIDFEVSEPVLGVIYQPITETLYSAHKGGGAFQNKKRIAVSKVTKLSDALLCTGFSFKRDEIFENEMNSFAGMVAKSHAIRRTGSAALDLTFVATGQFDGFWERSLNTWDVAAGLALVSEAGGTFTGIDGQPFRLGDQTIAASNTKVHREFIAALNARK
jgi:myo-inositol-1(or 4)-monophosphatase